MSPKILAKGTAQTLGYPFVTWVERDTKRDKYLNLHEDLFKDLSQDPRR